MLVSSENIKEPKIEVKPPILVKAGIGLFLMLLLALLAYLPIDNLTLKTAALAVYGLFLFGIVKKAFHGNYLITMQANRDGVFFQTDDANQYF